ncbi:MAG: cupin domain-containing protein [Blastocatellia bacterium]
MKLPASGCRVIAPDEGEWMTEGTRRYRLPISRRSGASEIAQAISLYQSGLAPARRNAHSEEVLYVSSGAGICHIDGHAYQVHEGHAVYIPPGALYQFENPHAEPLGVISVCCPEETSVEILPGKAPSSASASEPAPRLVIHESEREAMMTGDRSFSLLIHKDLGCQRVTQFLGVIPPSRAPHHYHTYEEAIFILQGSGIVHADDESCEFTPGTSIYLAPGQRHCLENPGTETVRLLGVFYPSGSPAVNYKD